MRLGFKEFEVLRLLLQNAKLVTPKDDIIAKVWGLDSEAEDNNVEVYISFLRKKLSFLASQVDVYKRQHPLLRGGERHLDFRWGIEYLSLIHI